MQDTILGRMETIITGAGLEPTIQRDLDNTGTVFALAEDFTCWVQVSYRFNAADCYITMRGPGIDDLDLVDKPLSYRVGGAVGPDGRSPSRDAGDVIWHNMPYTQGQRILNMFAILARAATADDPEGVAKALGHTPDGSDHHA